MYQNGDLIKILANHPFYEINQELYCLIKIVKNKKYLCYPTQVHNAFVEWDGLDGENLGNFKNNQEEFKLTLGKKFEIYNQLYKDLIDK